MSWTIEAFIVVRRIESWIGSRMKWRNARNPLMNIIHAAQSVFDFTSVTSSTDGRFQI
jgi:hypothetical protein